MKRLAVPPPLPRIPSLQKLLSCLTFCSSSGRDWIFACATATVSAVRSYMASASGSCGQRNKTNKERKGKKKAKERKGKEVSVYTIAMRQPKHDCMIARTALEKTKAHFEIKPRGCTHRHTHTQTHTHTDTHTGTHTDTHRHTGAQTLPS